MFRDWHGTGRREPWRDSNQRPLGRFWGGLGGWIPKGMPMWFKLFITGAGTTGAAVQTGAWGDGGFANKRGEELEHETALYLGFEG